jgi:hypothetical protein
MNGVDWTGSVLGGDSLVVTSAECLRGGGSRSAIEACLVCTSQVQRRDQPLECVAARRREPTFEVLHAARAEPGVLGKLLLSQACPCPVLPEQRSYAVRRRPR